MVPKLWQKPTFLLVFHTGVMRIIVCVNPHPAGHVNILCEDNSLTYSGGPTYSPECPHPYYHVVQTSLNPPPPHLSQSNPIVKVTVQYKSLNVVDEFDKQIYQVDNDRYLACPN